MTNGGNGSVFESMVDHSLWGVPGWLRDSIGGSGAQEVPSPALPSSGRSLGEQQTEFGRAVLPVPGSTWALHVLGPCPCHRAKPGSADVGQGHLHGMALSKGRRGSCFHPKGCKFGKKSIWGAGWLCCILAVLE